MPDTYLSHAQILFQISLAWRTSFLVIDLSCTDLPLPHHGRHVRFSLLPFKERFGIYPRLRLASHYVILNLSNLFHCNMWFVFVEYNLPYEFTGFYPTPTSKRWHNVLVIRYNYWFWSDKEPMRRIYNHRNPLFITSLTTPQCPPPKASTIELLFWSIKIP